MSEQSNGGPAFPQDGMGISRVNGLLHADHGMTLRDYMAAKAMHQMLHGAVIPKGYDASRDFEQVAAVAYAMADAMLRARQA